MDADTYFEFGARCLIKQLDIWRDSLEYDAETETFTFPANQFDVLMYERKGFEATLNSHMQTFKAYKEIVESLYGGYDDEENGTTTAP